MNGTEETAQRPSSIEKWAKSMSEHFVEEGTQKAYKYYIQVILRFIRNQGNENKETVKGLKTFSQSKYMGTLWPSKSIPA